MKHPIQDPTSSKVSRLRFAAAAVALVLAGLAAVISTQDSPQAQPDTGRMGAPDTSRMMGADTSRAATSGGFRGAGGPGGPQTPYEMPPLSQALFENLHNKIIHFPIVLTLVAAVMLLASRRRPELEPVAFWLVWTATVFTLAAFFSGVAQAEEFERRPKRWLVNTHRNWGIALAMAQSIWILTLLRRRTRGFAQVWGILVAGLVLVSAFLGGLVAHGRGRVPTESVGTLR